MRRNSIALAASALLGVLSLAAPAAADRARGIACDASLAARDRLLLGDRMAGASTVPLAAQLLRPTDPASTFAYGTPEAPPVCSPHFCVHYVTKGADAPPLDDADQNGSPDAVDALLDTLGEAREMLVGLGHDAHGVTDHALGGDSRMDVYLAQLEGMHGFAVPEALESESPPRMSSFMLVDSALVAASMTTLGKAVVAHELKHTFDFATFAAAPAWLFESSATWVEDQMVDETTSYSDFFPCWFLFPELSLDSTRSDSYPPAKKDTASCVFDNTHIYGSATFWFYAAARWGAELQGDVWNLAGTECGNFTPLDDTGPLRACVSKVLDGVLRDAGSSLSEAYGDFASEMFRPRVSSVLSTVETPAELEQWPERAHADQHEELPASASRTLKHLTTRYVELRAPEGRKGRASVKLGASQPDRAHARVLLLHPDGTHGTLPIAWDETGTGKATISGLGSEVSSAVLVIANVGSLSDADPDSLEVEYELGFEDLGKGDFIGSSPEASAPSASPSAGCSFSAGGSSEPPFAALVLLLGVGGLLRQGRSRPRPATRAEP